MKRVLLLAWRYVAYHKAKTVIMTLCLTLTAVLPLTAHLLITWYGDSLTERARATPLLAGIKGNRFGLTLKALYFGAAHVDESNMAEVEAIRETQMASPIPLHLRYTAREHPIVGTTLDYFEFRELTVAAGHGLQQMGQAVLGSNVAAALDLGPGDSLFSDQSSMYDITKSYPLKMHVAGVLAKNGSPDDNAVFVDMKTAWIIDGICHGHQDVSKTHDPAVILKRDDESVVTSAAIVEYNEVTPENVGTFHVHAEPPDLPVSAILVLPGDAKAATLIKARYSLSETHRILVPTDVVDELMGLVFRVKLFFDANFALIAISTLMFMILVVLLSQRIRKREMETMYKIGCSRLMVFWLQAAELGIVILMATALAGGLSIVALLAAPRIAGLM